LKCPIPVFVHDLERMVAAITPQTKGVFIANPKQSPGTMVRHERRFQKFMDECRIM